MLIALGFGVVACIILYKRSTEIITVNPLKGRTFSPEAREEEPQSVPDFARLVNTIQAASQKTVAAGGRAAIRRLVENDQFIEAMQLYRRVYGVDLEAAKKAIDEMMLEE